MGTILLALPFLLNSAFCLVVGLVAIYSFIFTGEAFWLVYTATATQDEALFFLLHLILSAVSMFPAIPFLCKYL